MAEQLPDDTPIEAVSDAEPPKIIKKKRVRRKKSGDLLDPYAYLATEFGKELVAPVSELPPDCTWYAWNGPPDAAALFFDTRKFERFTYIAELTGPKRPAKATGAVVFF